MSQVAEKLTPLSPAQAMGAIKAALPSGASQTALAMIAAQSAEETSSWKSMWNWSFGNVTPTPAQLTAGAPYVMHADTGTMRYLAFSDPVSGAKSLTGWLQGHGLLAAAEAGDLDSYMAGLQAGSYLGTIGLTDGSGHTVTQSDYDVYRAAIASLMAQFQTVAPVSPPWTGKQWAIGTSLVAAAAAAVWWRRPILAFARKAL